MVFGLFETNVRNVFHRVDYKAVNNSVEIAASFLENLKLFVGRRAAVENGVNMLDLFAGVERVNHIIDKIEQLADQVLAGNFFLLTEVKQHSVEAVAYRPPFVFLDQAAVI